MLEYKNVCLKVVNNKLRSFLVLPIKEEIENMKVSNIPRYMGLTQEETYIEVLFRDNKISVSDCIIYCKDSSVTILELVIFSLLYTVRKTKAMMNSMSTWINSISSYIENPTILSSNIKTLKEALKNAERVKNGLITLEDFAYAESKAKDVLSQIIDESLLKKICDEISPTDTDDSLFNLIKENIILSSENSK